MLSSDDLNLIGDLLDIRLDQKLDKRFEDFEKKIDDKLDYRFSQFEEKLDYRFEKSEQKIMLDIGNFIHDNLLPLFDDLATKEDIDRIIYKDKEQDARLDKIELILM